MSERRGFSQGDVLPGIVDGDQLPSDAHERGNDLELLLVPFRLTKIDDISDHDQTPDRLRRWFGRRDVFGPDNFRELAHVRDHEPSSLVDHREVLGIAVDVDSSLAILRQEPFHLDGKVRPISRVKLGCDLVPDDIAIAKLD